MKKLGFSFVGSMAMIGTQVQAAVSTTVTTALSDAATDVGTVGSAVLVVIVAAAVFKYMRRAL